MTKTICVLAAAAAFLTFGNAAQAANRGRGSAHGVPQVSHSSYRPHYNPGYQPHYPQYNPGYRPSYPTYRPPVNWISRNIWLIPNCRPVWHATYQVWYYIDPYTGAVYYWYTSY